MWRLVAAVGLVAVASGASAQTLGEASTRERERREQRPRKGSPARVLTADDLATTTGRIANDPTVTPDAVPSVAPPPAAVPALVTTGSVEAEQARHAQREAHWRGEARRRREALSLAEDALQRAERWSDPTYAGKDQPWCPITRRNQQKRARTELARARLSLQALEEEARVAGALPGWIR